MSMWMIRSRQRYTHPILRITLPNNIRNNSSGINPPTIPTPNGTNNPLGLTFWRRNNFFLILAHPVYKM